MEAKNFLISTTGALGPTQHRSPCVGSPDHILPDGDNSRQFSSSGNKPPPFVPHVHSFLH